MADNRDIKALREQVTRDTETLKHEKLRLAALQDKAPEDITEADRRFLLNWDSNTMRAYSARLDLMEQNENPSNEDKEAMRLLYHCIIFGDQIKIHVNQIVRKIEEKFGKVNFDLDADESDVVWTKDGKRMRRVKVKKSAAETESRSTPVLEAAGTPVSPAPSTPKAQNVLSAATGTAFQAPLDTPQAANEPARNPKHARVEQAENVATPQAPEPQQVAYDPDPKGIYALLGVAPDVPMKKIEIAYRKKQIALHPDRNHSPNASDEFNEFMSLYDLTLATEEKREAYSKIKTADQLQELDKRMRQLTMKEKVWSSK